MYSVQLLVLLGKDDVVVQEGEHLRDGTEALPLGLQRNRVVFVGVLALEHQPGMALMRKTTSSRVPW